MASMAKKPFVSILMGSERDWEIMRITSDALKALEIHCEVKILSAHRTPQATVQYVQEADHRGCAVFIAAAGLAAHLAGVVASHTLKPVIGVPLNAGSLGGLDALLSTVQMPGGTPVACTSIGAAGAKNAAILAAQILSLFDESLINRLEQYRAHQRNAVETASNNLIIS